MNTKMNVLELLFLILTALCVVYAVIIYRVGSGTLSFVIWIAGAVFFGLAAFLAGNGRWLKLPVVLRKVSYCLIVLLALVFLCCFAAMISHFGDKGDKKLDYIVVLGAQMRHQKPSLIFKYRLDAAYTYLAGHPDTICIVSGGKGSNEPVSEGDGGKEYLMSKGIPAERILAETKALNTRENISNSLALMDRAKGSTQKLRIGIVTNNYHVFRGVHLAKSLTKDKVFGIASHTVPLYLPNNMVRECFGIIRDLPMLYTRQHRT